MVNELTKETLVKLLIELNLQEKFFYKERKKIKEQSLINYDFVEKFSESFTFFDAKNGEKHLFIYSGKKIEYLIKMQIISHDKKESVIENALSTLLIKKVMEPFKLTEDIINFEKIEEILQKQQYVIVNEMPEINHVMKNMEERLNQREKLAKEEIGFDIEFFINKKIIEEEGFFKKMKQRIF